MDGTGREPTPGAATSRRERAMWKEYEAPTTVAEALAILQARDGAARVIAGGTDLALQAQRGRGRHGLRRRRHRRRRDERHHRGRARAGHRRLRDPRAGGRRSRWSAGTRPPWRPPAPPWARRRSGTRAPSAATSSMPSRRPMRSSPCWRWTPRSSSRARTACAARRSTTLFAGPGESAVDPTREILVQVRASGCRRRASSSAFARLARRRALALPMLNVAVVVRPAPAARSTGRASPSARWRPFRSALSRPRQSLQAGARSAETHRARGADRRRRGPAALQPPCAATGVPQAHGAGAGPSCADRGADLG